MVNWTVQSLLLLDRIQCTYKYLDCFWLLQVKRTWLTFHLCPHHTTGDMEGSMGMKVSHLLLSQYSKTLFWGTTRIRNNRREHDQEWERKQNACQLTILWLHVHWFGQNMVPLYMFSYLWSVLRIHFPYVFVILHVFYLFLHFFFQISLLRTLRLVYLKNCH